MIEPGLKGGRCNAAALVAYLLASLSGAAYAFAELHPRLTITPFGRLCLLGVFCVCMYIGGRSLCRRAEADREKIMKLTFAVCFALYLYLLLRFTLFDPAFGRKGRLIFIFSDMELLRDHLTNSVNVVPFATIWKFSKGIFTGEISGSAIAVNIFGNLLAFAPMGIFLPVFFRKCRQLGYLALSAALSVLAVELLQLLLVTGAFDIDDLILNVLGACAAFYLMKLEPIKRLVSF